MPVWSLTRTAERLMGQAPRVKWYLHYDLPRAWGATRCRREMESSFYYCHFYISLRHKEGKPKPALEEIKRQEKG